jgi:hypothetical protein
MFVLLYDAAISAEWQDDWWIGKDLQGRKRSPNDVLSLSLTRGTEDDHETPQKVCVSTQGRRVTWLIGASLSKETGVSTVFSVEINLPKCTASHLRFNVTGYVRATVVTFPDTNRLSDLTPRISIQIDLFGRERGKETARKTKT